MANTLFNLFLLSILIGSFILLFDPLESPPEVGEIWYSCIDENNPYNKGCSYKKILATDGSYIEWDFSYEDGTLEFPGTPTHSGKYWNFRINNDRVEK